MSRRSLCAGALAIAMTAAVPAVATAPKPVRGGQYGGGVISAVNTKGHLDVQYTQAIVQKDGKSLNFYGDWRAPCPSGNNIGGAGFVAKKVPIKSDGSFSGSGDLTGSGPGGTQTGTATFKGRFVSPGVATGSGDAGVDVKPNTGSPEHCSLKPTFTIVAPGKPGTTGTRKGGATYYGQGTSKNQNLPTLFRLAASGKKMAQASLEFGPDCQNAKQTSPITNETMPGPNITVTKSGFSGHEDYDSTNYVPGQLWKFHFDLTGTFGPSKVKGTWTMTTEVFDATTNQQVDSCHLTAPFSMGRPA